MKKIIFKLLIVLTLIFLFSTIVINSSNAASTSWKSIEQQAKNFIDQGENSKVTEVEEQMGNIVIPIAQILVVIGTIVVVVAATIMGIKYMVANPEEKAKLKTQLIGLVVATIVIFAAQFIWSTVYYFFENF